ncbi:MAG: hypothetical protein IPL46_00775 [Saprospiraceae bacterium]|nr:hypothetical protein [Saprospiraceae bacterium]
MLLGNKNKNKLCHKWGFLFFILSFVMGLACKQSTLQNASVVGDWIRIGPGGGGATFIPSFSYSDAETYLVRCDMTGAYLTHDGGYSFSQINYPNGSQAFAFDPTDKDRIFIGANGLHRSTDGGKTTERIFPNKNDVVSEAFYDEHGDYELTLAEKTMYHGISKLNGSNPVKNIKVDPTNSNAIYFSIGKYLFFTENDGVLWNRIELDNAIEYIYTDSTEILFVFSENSLYEIRKGNWTFTYHSLPEEMQPAFSFAAGTKKSNKNAVFYALHNDVDLRADGGVSPTTLWISNDKGQSWHQTIDKTITNDGGETPTYSMLATAEHDASNVYLIANSYNVPKGDDSKAHWYGALKSVDAGITWDWVWKGGGGSGQYAVKDGVDASNLKDAWVRNAFGGEYVRLMDVGVAPFDGNIAIITDWYRTMKTLDGGLNWVSVYSREISEGRYTSTGLDVTTSYGLHFDPFEPDHLAISYTDMGYHHSFDGGLTWVKINCWHSTPVAQHLLLGGI